MGTETGQNTDSRMPLPPTSPTLDRLIFTSLVLLYVLSPSLAATRLEAANPPRAPDANVEIAF